MDEAFRESPWPLYGLPESVPCRRYLAGWGRSGEVTTALELGHLSPDGSLEKQLRIEVTPITERRQEPEDYKRGLWRRAHLTGHAGEDLDALRRRMEKVEQDYETEAHITWETVTITIDGEPRVCEQARLGDHWIALLEDGSTSVVISGQDWPDHAPELVTVQDVEPYVQGSLRVWQEGFKRP